MKTICTLLCLCILSPLMAIVKLPSVVSDNMMIQRDTPAKLWGWADNGETINIAFNGQTVKAKAGKDGIWRAQLKAMPYGGPYEMTITGKSNKITLKNILIGDIWVCGGQSNMEWVVGSSNKAGEEVAQANYPKIRLLTVNKNMANAPLLNADASGWVECNPQNVIYFSAIGYFFGRDLYKQLDIPIGLINASLGGTNIETWMSIPAMLAQPDYKQKMDALQSADVTAKLKTEKPDMLRLMETDPGTVQKWYLPETSTSQWKLTHLPGQWRTENLSGYGIVWYRKEFTLNAEQIKNPVTINLGSIDDWDEAYLNGKKIGTTLSYSAQRQYVVNPDGLKEGKNVLVVKLINAGGNAGFMDGMDKMFCQISRMVRIPLAGEWLYRASMMVEGSAEMVDPNEYPSLLYNGMIAPLTYFPIKGVIWYQGESNAGAAYRYRTLFTDMIADWRKGWGQGNFPFYYVQLANYMAPVAEPRESNWAELREAQHLALQTPNTGEAVAIDVGESGSIHPTNKQDVGYRLAIIALAKTYGKSIEYSGPEYQSMQVSDNQIILTFNHTGKGLIAKGKYGYLQGFAIAGADQKFVWAKARIEGNTVIVSSDQVSNPMAVRYAWANNPDDANLYNSEGLPASPFRTDNWKLSTQK